MVCYNDPVSRLDVVLWFVYLNCPLEMYMRVEIILFILAGVLDASAVRGGITTTTTHSGISASAFYSVVNLVRSLFQSVATSLWSTFYIRTPDLSERNIGDERSATIPEVTRLDGVTAAVQSESFEDIESLLKNGANVNESIAPSGETPLLAAVGLGRLDIVELLCQNGANVDQTDLVGHSPLYTAVRRGSLQLVEFLVEHGATVEGGRHCSILMVACQRDYFQIARILILRGANVNRVGCHGSTTPLMVAARRGHVEVVKLLLANGADASMVDSNGRSALLLAMEGHDSHTSSSFYDDVSRQMYRDIVDAIEESMTWVPILK